MAKKLSIVICTFDRYETLAGTVDSILNSRSFAKDDFEIVVVDNTPEYRRETGYLASRPAVRAVVCEESGLSHARNCGIAVAEGPIVAFLDDDVIVSDDWCANMLRVFDMPEAQVAGGKVIPQFSTSRLPPWYDDKLAEYLSCVDWSSSARRLRPGEWIVGANMAFRRTVFETFGGFNVDLGRKGTASLLSNDESALIEKIGLHNVYYSPDAWVHHIIPQDRVTLKWFRRRVYWQAVSDMVAGLTSAQEAEARKEYGEIIAGFEAERRNLNSIFFEPRDFSEFSQQLRAIYLAAVIFGAGGV